MERISGIYKITCVPTGKVYIGQSNNIYKRWTDHRLELRKNQHINNYLQRAWNKYGEAQFEFEIIKKCNIDEMDKWEQYYIAILNSNNLNYGFNLDSGGSFNKTHSKSTIEKIVTANQKKIYQFSPDFKLINSYKSLKKLQKSLEFHILISHRLPMVKEIVQVGFSGVILIKLIEIKKSLV